jgi:hypothetical protein
MRQLPQHRAGFSAGHTCHGVELKLAEEFDNVVVISVDQFNADFRKAAFSCSVHIILLARRPGCLPRVLKMRAASLCAFRSSRMGPDAGMGQFITSCKSASIRLGSY